MYIHLEAQRWTHHSPKSSNVSDRICYWGQQALTIGPWSIQHMVVFSREGGVGGAMMVERSQNNVNVEEFWATSSANRDWIRVWASVRRSIIIIIENIGTQQDIHRVLERRGSWKSLVKIVVHTA